MCRVDTETKSVPDRPNDRSALLEKTCRSDLWPVGDMRLGEYDRENAGQDEGRTLPHSQGLSGIRSAQEVSQWVKKNLDPVARSIVG